MTELTTVDYARAERMLAHNRARLVPGAKIRPRWLDDGTRFWYRLDGEDGRRFVLVDPDARVRRPAFDHDALAAALSEASGTAVEGGRLPFGAIEMVADGVEFDAFGSRWRYAGEALTRVEGHRPVAMGELPSPDGKWVAFRRGHDIWVRSADGAEEFPLTDDGEPYHDYGSNLDVAMSRIMLRNLGLTLPPMVLWSPDSRRLLTHRIDQRSLPEQVIVESTPDGGGRPVAHHYRYPMPGDDEHATMSYVVLDVAERTVTREQGEPAYIGFRSPIALKKVRWSEDGTAVHFLRSTRDARTVGLYRLDPDTGAVRLLIEESGDTRVDTSLEIIDEPPVRVLSSGEILWWSQRDGWAHLYLYDADGAQAGRVTGGPWAVRRVLHVDERARVVYFVASGLLEDPYVRQICKVNLDGTGFTRMTEDRFDHDVVPSKSGRVLVDSASAVDTAPRTVVLDLAGEVLVEVEQADTGALEEAGWSAPERFSATAADGLTRIHGTVWRPYDFDPAGSYPVIDHIYPGPQIHRARPSFDSLAGTGEPEALAALGFVVVAVDGRGTPGRSKAFLDESYGNLATAGMLEDHVAAIRQLAARYRWMDTGRVGIFGASGGGFATARALLTHPGFYSVGVAGCGDHDMRHYLAMWAEHYLGDPTEDNLRSVSNPALAENLRGKLLLIHGELDDNVLPSQTLNLVDALIRADKDFDLLVVPGVEHAFLGRQHYIQRRQWDYFVRHLHGTEPPRYSLRPVPLTADHILDLLS
ncbi:S9 family peptidase [Amycolatopsis suaedae]|uniref:S9 family peptidase n=1 Tax=Amycolatopsis suaedae TaxID=2510978 RepID=A0A4Q7JC30_9PSEU|nr:DPP IV N-terminal domain-containing protein [Amycolatopsis suaedae]RZQ64596.1 S9 family peptidase [Amycolatopsis suaedae]